MSCFLNWQACSLPLSHLGSPTTEALTIYHSSTLSNFSYSHLILMVKLALCLFLLKQAIKHKTLNNLLIVTQLVSGSPETQSQVVWLKGPYSQKLLSTMMNTHSVPRILLFPVRETMCAASPDNNCPQTSPAITHTCTKSFSMIMLTPHFHWDSLRTIRKSARISPSSILHWKFICLLKESYLLTPRILSVCCVNITNFLQPHGL